MKCASCASHLTRNEVFFPHFVFLSTGASSTGGDHSLGFSARTHFKQTPTQQLRCGCHMSDASSYVSSRQQRSSQSPSQHSQYLSSQLKASSVHSSGSQRSRTTGGGSERGGGSGGSSSGSNPFRNGSRDNLPSFADCFDGFNKFDNIGEHHIAAMSPQQAWTAPPPTATWSGGGGGGHHSSSSHQSSSRQPSSSAHYNSSAMNTHGASLHRSSSRSAAQLSSPPPSNHHVPISSMFSPIQRGSTPNRQSGTGGASTPHSKGSVGFGAIAADSPGRSLPQSHDIPQPNHEQFSYRTLDLSEDDEAASDAIGTPPRAIERAEDDEGNHGSPVTQQHQQYYHQHPTNDGTPTGRHEYHEGNPIAAGLSTPNNRPPLHPAALSPIVAGSPIFEGGRVYRGTTPPQEEPRHTPPSVYLQSPHSERTPPPPSHRGEHLSSADHRQHHHDAAAARTVNPTLLTPPRRARSFEELAAKHLFPLFGAFLRSLPPKQLENFLVHDDAIFDDDPNTAQTAHNYPSAEKLPKYSFHYDTRSVDERVNAIVPPLNDLLDTPREAFGSSPYAYRDFAYRHPVYSDTIGTSLRLRLSGW